MISIFSYFVRDFLMGKAEKPMLKTCNLHFLTLFSEKITEKISKNRNHQKIFLIYVRNHILSTPTKFEVAATYRLREKKYTLCCIFWTTFTLRLRFRVRNWILPPDFSEIFDFLPSSTRRNFFHRSRSPKRLYIFEKCSPRSLHFRCLFGEITNLAPSTMEIKFIEFREIQNLDFHSPTKGLEPWFPKG